MQYITYVVRCLRSNKRRKSATKQERDSMWWFYQKIYTQQIGQCIFRIQNFHCLVTSKVSEVCKLVNDISPEKYVCCWLRYVCAC